MKSYLLAILFIIMATQLEAQNLWINGRIFSVSENTAKAVPFATIKYYDYDSNKLVYQRCTDFTGNYDLGKKVKIKKFRITIEAPGYISRTKNIGNLPESWKDNMTLHFKMIPDSKHPLRSELIKKDVFKHAKNCMEALKKIPHVKSIEDGDIISSNGRTIMLLINGSKVPSNKFSKLLEIPTDAIKSVTYYNMDSKKHPYEGAIDIMLIVGEHEQLSFMPGETTYFDIK